MRHISNAKIYIDISYDSSKLFTTITESCRVILCSADLDRYNVLYFLVDRFNQLQDQI